MSGFDPLKAVVGVVTFVPRVIISVPGMVIEHQREMERKREREKERQATPPSYDDGVSEEDFEGIVLKAKKSIRRIKSVDIKGFVVVIEVKSQAGITIWKATVDFNDFGHLTGWYKIRTENNDSKIPEAFAREVNEGISACKENS